MIDINLLPPKNVLTRKEQGIRQKLLVGVIISSMFCLLLGGMLLLFGFGLSKQVDDLNNQKRQLTTSYGTFKETALEIRVLQGKIAGIKKIKALRFDYASEITTLNSFLKDTSTIKKLTLNPPNSVLLVASSPDVASLNGFLGRITSQEGKVPLKGVVISGLSLDDSGFVYNVAGGYVP